MHLPLPPTQIRQGGGPLRYDDDYFLESARYDAELLMSVGLRPGSRLLDFGCGPGRVAIGLIASEWSGSYLGVEVQNRHVSWATSDITSRFPDFRFVWVDASNDRYNPDGSEPNRLPVDDAWVDLICAFSVFSHMLSDQTAAYLSEFRRALTSDGKAFITAFVADDVPDETENPPWLGEWKGRLHCVLYSTTHLSRLIQGEGLVLEDMVPMDNRKQVGLLLGVDVDDDDTANGA
jgi:cyclopropane fatty-acyl-phospholipid synthase-like methyltransferase